VRRERASERVGLAEKRRQSSKNRPQTRHEYEAQILGRRRRTRRRGGVKAADSTAWALKAAAARAVEE
jgi:hypothetical protein